MKYFPLSVKLVHLQKLPRVLTIPNQPVALQIPSGTSLQSLPCTTAGYAVTRSLRLPLQDSQVMGSLQPARPLAPQTHAPPCKEILDILSPTSSMQPEPYLKPDNQKANPNLIIRSLADNLTRHWCPSSPSQPGSQHLRKKALHAAAYKPYRRMLRGFRLQREGGKEGEGCEKRCCVPVACIESQGPAALYLPLLCAPPSPRSAVQEAGGCSQDPCSRAGPGASTASQLQVPAQQHPAGRERPLLGGIS